MQALLPSRLIRKRTIICAVGISVLIYVRVRHEPQCRQYSLSTNRVHVKYELLSDNTRTLAKNNKIRDVFIITREHTTYIRDQTVTYDNVSHKYTATRVALCNALSLEVHSPIIIITLILV